MFIILLLSFFVMVAFVKAQNVFVDPCSSNPCLKGGRCDRIGTGSNYLCVCTAGHWGQHCEYNPGEMPCDGHKCASGSTCRPDTNENIRYRCYCGKGFTGKFCNITKISTAKQQCELFCGHRGKAYIDKKKQCKCKCHEDLYEGDNCSKALPCASMPCRNEGVCKNKHGKTDYECQCKNMYYQTRNCTTPKYCRNPFEYCDPAKNPCPLSYCKNDGICMLVSSDPKKKNTWVDPKAECRCKSGFKGKQCQTKATPCTLTDEQDYCNDNIDDPEVNEACGNMTQKLEVCYNGGTCSIYGKPPNETKLCQCKGKWVGKECTLEDPCLANSSICSKNSVCISLPSEHGTRFGHICVCNPGYSASDCHALDPNVCNDTNKVVCHHGGICVRCYDPNSPTSSPYCRTSEDFLRHHVCACAIRRTGPLCDQTTLPCDIRRCKNGGKCIDMNETDYMCECLDGYSGDNCEVIDDMCVARSPCMNGGYCTNVDTSLGFDCECSEGYYGVACQLEYYEFASYFMTFYQYLTIWSFIAGCIACVLFGVFYSLILICIVRTKEKQM